MPSEWKRVVSFLRMPVLLVLLVDMTGRVIREGKRGAISMHQPPILERLEIANESWLESATQFEMLYRKKFARKRRQQHAA